MFRSSFCVKEPAHLLHRDFDGSGNFGSFGILCSHIRQILFQFRAVNACAGGRCNIGEFDFRGFKGFHPVFLHCFTQLFTHCLFPILNLLLLQGQVCNDLDIPTKSNRVDIGVRVELPALIFSHLTDELYESKIVYRTQLFEDNVRTFCMNPHGIVVNENTNGIVTVNGHSYEGADKQTENTNFALLVAKHFSEPFKDSNGYGESIARLSNMLGGGVIVQRFGDLVRGRRSNEKRIEEGLVTPTLSATPGDLSLVLPKRILDGIIEMIYALDKIAPGTANDDTLLYGVEVKFYNMEVELNDKLESKYKGLYIIGDGSGVTHSLSHASASGVYVAREIEAER